MSKLEHPKAEILKRLPRGSNSDVFANLNDKKNVAIKILNRDDEESKKNFRHEFDTLREYGDDKYIIKTYGIATNDDAILYLLKGLSYLESVDLYHGDIKMENIGVFYTNDHRENIYKFIDFEHSKWLSVHRDVTIRDRDLVSYKTPGMGNDEFLMIKSGLIDEEWQLGKQDVCAMGKTLIDIYHKTTIDYGKCYRDTTFGIVHEGFYDHLHDRLDMVIAPIRESIVNMVRTDPNNRYWASDILEKLYF